MVSTKEYKSELEAWCATLSNAQRDVIALAVSDEMKPRHANDMIGSLEMLIARMRRIYPERTE